MRARKVFVKRSHRQAEDKAAASRRRYAELENIALTEHARVEEEARRRRWFVRLDLDLPRADRA
jgi:cell division protein FtsL